MTIKQVDLCDEVLGQLRKIVRAMELYSRHLYRVYSMTSPQLLLLREISRYNNITLGALAQKVSLSNATVTGIVDRLEQRGWVQRLRNGEDRRQIQLACTEQGQSVVDEAPALFQEQFVTALGGLQQWEQTQILASLTHLATMMASSTLSVPLKEPFDSFKPQESSSFVSDGFLASCQMLLDKESPESVPMHPSSDQTPSILTVHSESDLPQGVTLDSLAEFLHQHLRPYEDALEDIGNGLRHAFSPSPQNHGFVLLAWTDRQLSGALVMLDTGMSGYVPEHLLLFIAVNESQRGCGIGRQLIQAAQKACSGAIKLHVEYNNPARRLYERMGFSSKYAEMRWIHEPSMHKS